LLLGVYKERGGSGESKAVFEASIDEKIVSVYFQSGLGFSEGIDVGAPIPPRVQTLGILGAMFGENNRTVGNNLKEGK